MEKLINEFSVGLFFWQSVLFIALVLLLRKFAWKPILNAVNERENKISNALEEAKKAEERLQALNNENETLLKEARAERDSILKEARETKEAIVSEAKNSAKDEAEKIISSAREAINNEKQAAMIELKNQVAVLSIDVAEKIIKSELSSDAKQKELATSLAEEVTV